MLTTSPNKATSYALVLQLALLTYLPNLTNLYK